MHRTKHAIAAVALAVAIVGTVAVPAATAAQPRRSSAQVAPIDRHMPLTAALGALDRHQP
ncbi:hypothetical protein [Streptomyces sp. NPDC101150]|uniref:hypothetical protein n=1 Tax=Streptomyces sp. NPDC101150 TaxID=3366114 RepID=UPI00382ABAAB